MGPSVVVLVQPGHWTVRRAGEQCLVGRGAVGSGGREPGVAAVLHQLQPEKKGWSLSMSPTITANWQASSGNVWTVPVGGGVARVFRLGFQPMNASAAFFGNAVHPAGGSPWSMRAQLSFLFPKRAGGAKKD
jgi:hypothetical protein